MLITFPVSSKEKIILKIKGRKKSRFEKNRPLAKQIPWLMYSYKEGT